MSTNHEHDNLNKASGAENTESFGERIFRVNDAVTERVGRITETVLRTVLGESGLQKLDAFIDQILPTSDQPVSNQSQEPTGGYNPPDYPYDERNPFSTTEHFEPGSERRLSSYHTWILDKPETEPWPGRPEQVTHEMLTERANGNVAPYTKEEITHALHRNDQLDVAQHASGIGKGPSFEIYNFFGKEGTFVSEAHSPATIWLPDRIDGVVNDVYHATTQQSEYVERMVEAREAGRDPGPPPRHIFQDLIDRSNERGLSGSGQDLRTNTPAAGKASIQVADVIVDLQGLAQSAHHNVDHASARGVRIGGEIQGYAVDISASDVGRDGFDLIQFTKIPGTFVTQFHDTMHVSGDLPDVIRDIADAQVLRDAGEIAPHRPVFDDLREASLQREEQSRHIKDVTNYLQEIEAADAELTRLREHDLAAGREEAGQAPGSQQTFTLTRDDLRKVLDSAVFLSLEYRDAEGKIDERSIVEVADRTIERLEARAESAHEKPTPNDQNASPDYKESFTLPRERLAKLLDTAIDTSHQPGVGKEELIGWIMTDLDYKADTPNTERTFEPTSSLLGSPALSKLIDTCERAIDAEQDFKGGGNPYIEHCERLNWVNPMKEAVAEVRQERQREIDTWLSQQKEQTIDPADDDLLDLFPGNPDFEDLDALTDPEAIDPLYYNIEETIPDYYDDPDLTVKNTDDKAVENRKVAQVEWLDDAYSYNRETGEIVWPNDTARLTIHELAEGAHHQVAPYSSDEVLRIAEKDRLQVDASAIGVGYQDDKFDVTAFRAVPGAFVSQGDSTVHVSTNFRETVDGVYQAQDLRASDGKYADIHVYSDLVEKSEGIDQKTRDRQLTLERSLER